MTEKSEIHWNEKDYNTAWDFLLDNEALAKKQILLDTEKGVSVILPSGLPGLGMRFVGFFMVAPILIFMATLLLFPFIILGAPWTWAPLSFVIFILSLVLLLGLAWVLKLMMNNRDLFPRAYYITLGEKGIAMHYSRWHKPWGPAKVAIPWEQVRTAQAKDTLFLPALFLGTARITTLQVVSNNGDMIEIPYRSPQDAHLHLAMLRDRVKP